jgi:hypothetical protein
VEDKRIESVASASGSSGQEEGAVSKNWSSLGLHRYRVEDDLLIMELAGAFVSTDVDQYLQLVEGLLAKHGYYLLLVDMRHGFMLGAAERRRLIKWLMDHEPVIKIAILGAALPARALISLVFGTTRLLGQDQYYAEYFPHEAAAREWFSKQRHELRQRPK